MLNKARADMVSAPHVAVFSSLAIFLAVPAFNVLGDGGATPRIPRSNSGTPRRALADDKRLSSPCKGPGQDLAQDLARS